MPGRKGTVDKIWLESIFATLFILFFMAALNAAFQRINLEGFDAVGQALKDMDITDYAFSELRSDSLPPDNNVIIVNIGPLGRAGIADQIRIIDKYGAKVIGIDGFFKGYAGDTLATYNLADAINNAKAEVVMAAKVEQSDSLLEIAEGDEVYDILYTSDSLFIQNVHLALANLDTKAKSQHDVKICRAFPPQRTVINTGENHIAFGAKMAALYDSTKLAHLLNRNNDFELINFRGDVLLSPMYFDYTTGTLGQRIVDDKHMCFQALDWDQVLAEDFDPAMINDKIILVGYLGDRLGAPQWEDKFFTPLNSEIAGRANPDMYGPVIHANIVSMILNEDYINGFGNFTEGIIGVVLLYINVFLFSMIYARMGAWYDGITKLIQLIELMVLTVIVIYIFASQNFKLELAIAFFGIALVGDMLEIYYGVIKNIFSKKTWDKLVTLGTKKE